MSLGPGSIAFVGINTNGTDWFAFVAINPIPAGTVIYFTDNELPTSTSTSFNTGESYTKWIAPAGGVDAGTVVNFSPFFGPVAPALVVNVGTASQVTFAGSANTGLSTGQDSLYAYLANDDATVNTPTTYLAFINVGTTADPVPPALAANQQISFITVSDSASYTGSHNNHPGGRCVDEARLCARKEGGDRRCRARCPTARDRAKVGRDHRDTPTYGRRSARNHRSPAHRKRTRAHWRSRKEYRQAGCRSQC
jgi:hypothetical protein